jgi:hypothetical protein
MMRCCACKNRAFVICVCVDLKCKIGIHSCLSMEICSTNLVQSKDVVGSVYYCCFNFCFVFCRFSNLAREVSNNQAQLEQRRSEWEAMRANVDVAEILQDQMAEIAIARQG